MLIGRRLAPLVPQEEEERRQRQVPSRLRRPTRLVVRGIKARPRSAELRTRAAEASGTASVVGNAGLDRLTLRPSRLVARLEVGLLDTLLVTYAEITLRHGRTISSAASVPSDTNGQPPTSFANAVACPLASRTPCRLVAVPATGFSPSLLVPSGVSPTRPPAKWLCLAKAALADIG